MTYQPKVLPVTVEVADLEAFGRIGSPITATPDYSQDQGMPVIDIATVSFVDSLDAAYPATVQRTKTVAGEGSWSINADGSISFVPEKGFAGNPTPVYYKAKNTGGVVSYDDKDNTDGRTGTGTVTYEYASAFGHTATTVGDQGKPQTSFDTQDSADAGFANAQAMFKNLPKEWYTNFKYALVGADGKNVTTLTVDGQGTYTIDPATGIVTFQPLNTFTGTAQTVKITISEGYTNINGQDPAPIATWTPTVLEGNILVRSAYGSGEVGQPVSVTPNYKQLTNQDGTPWSPIKLDSVSFLDQDGKYPSTPIKELKVDGEGTWTIDNTGKFTFTPEPGFAGTPTAQPYTAQNEDGLVASPAQVGVVYGGLVSRSATTANTQGKEQHSTDTGSSNNGLTRDEMFPTVPADWFAGTGLLGLGDPVLTTKLVDENGNLVEKVTRAGQGTFEIDPKTGVVTFTPEPTFSGKADPVTVAVDGLFEYDEAGNKSPISLTATYTPFVTEAGTVLPNAYQQVEKTGIAGSTTPNYQSGGYNIDPTTVTFLDADGNYPKTPILEKVVDGEGTWKIDPTTGEFTFTPEPGYTLSPTPVTYGAKDKDNGATATGGTVSMYYPEPYTVPATTTAPQGTVQHSFDTDGQDAGLTPAQMFPTLPEAWFGENATEKRADGTPLVQFYMVDADGKRIEANADGKYLYTVSTVDNETGKTIEAGTYELDPISGEIKFTPNPLFLGKAPSVTIFTDGLTQELRSEYTPFYFPARVELPSDRQVQPTLGQPTSSKFTNDEWTNSDFTIDKNSITLLPSPKQILVNGEEQAVPGTLSADGKTLTVPGEGTWTVELVGDAPAEGQPDEREVKFTFTPEPGFIGQPTELQYTGKNTDGVPSSVPGQVVFVYPTADPQDAITQAYQGQTQLSSDSGTGDQGLTVGEMFPRIAEVPASWNVHFKLVTGYDADGNPTYGDTYEVPGEGTYTLNSDGTVQFVPAKDFVGTAKPATISVWVGEGDTEKATEATAKYTAVVLNFGDPRYQQVIVDTGETAYSQVKAPAGIPLDDNGNPIAVTYAIDQDWLTNNAPAGWTITIDDKTGEVKVVAPQDSSQMVAFEVPVKASYADGQTRDTTAPFSPLVSTATKRPLVFDTKIEYVDDLKPGETRVVTDGKLGEQTLVNGEWTTTTQPVTQVIQVSSQIKPDAGSYSWTKPIPYDTKFVENPDLKPGETRVKQPGELGQETWSAEVSVDDKGNLVLKDPVSAITKPAVDQIIEIGPDAEGSAKTTVTVPVPFPTEIVFDSNLKPGEMVVDVEGVDGEKDVTTTSIYKDGQITQTTAERVTKEPVTRVVRVGAKLPDEKDVRVVDYPTRFVYDDTLLPGQTRIDQTGQSSVRQFVGGVWTELIPSREQIVRVGVKVDPTQCDVPERVVEKIVTKLVPQLPEDPAVPVKQNPAKPPVTLAETGQQADSNPLMMFAMALGIAGAFLLGRGGRRREQSVE